MTPEEYCRLASRTECDQWAARRRYSGVDLTGDDRLIPIRLAHGIMGLTGEIGELASTVVKHLHFGQPLDKVAIKDEAGDCLWYLVLVLDSVGISLNEVMEGNIRKLKTRYPDRYSDVRATEEGRDREAERASLTTTGIGNESVLDTPDYKPCPVGEHDWRTVSDMSGIPAYMKCRNCEKIIGCCPPDTPDNKFCLPNEHDWRYLYTSIDLKKCHKCGLVVTY